MWALLIGILANTGMLLASGPVSAQVLALGGLLGNRALLVIDGGAPSLFAPGQRKGAILYLRPEGDTALFEVNGQRLVLRVGEQPLSVGSREASAPEVTLVADVRGHFSTAGSINGRSVRFLVDTGASQVVLGQATARDAGINYLGGVPGAATTAAGTVPVWRVRLRSVVVGGIRLQDVDALVVQSELPSVLLGMSFLNRMEMRRDGSTMILRQRY